GRPVASLAFRRVTVGKRSVDSKEMGREDSAPKSMHCGMPRLLFPVEGCIGFTDMRGDPEPPESLALGTFSKGFSRNLGKPHSLLRQQCRGSRRSRATRDGPRWVVRDLTSPYYR